MNQLGFPVWFTILREIFFLKEICFALINHNQSISNRKLVNQIVKCVSMPRPNQYISDVMNLGRWDRAKQQESSTSRPQYSPRERMRDSVLIKSTLAHSLHVHKHWSCGFFPHTGQIRASSVINRPRASQTDLRTIKW